MSLPFQKLCPCEKSPLLRIKQVPLIAISFLLKGYMIISLFPVSELYPTENPFNYIPKIKKDKEHFPLLKRMNILMVFRYTT